MKKVLLNKIRLTSVFGLLVASFVGCSDILEESPSAFIPKIDASVISEGLLTSVENGLYGSLAQENIFDANGYPTIWGDVGVDVFGSPTFATTPPAVTNNFLPSNEQVNDMWQTHYKALSGVNSAIATFKDVEVEEGSSLEQPLKNLLGSARFIKAILYFNLVKAYERPVIANDLPETVDEVIAQEKPGNATPKEVYELIISELQQAIVLLDDARSSQFATKSGAKALLGKVYLQIAGLLKNNVIQSGFEFKQSAKDFYTLSNKMLDEVINSVDSNGKEVEGAKSYALEKDYSDVFDPSKEGQNSEIIFGVSFKSGGTGSNYGDYYGIIGGPPNGGFQNVLPLFELIYSFYDDFRASEVTFNNLFDSDYPLPVSDSRFLVTFSTFDVQGFNNNPGDLSKLNKNVSPGSFGAYKWIKPIPAPEGETFDRPFDFPYLRYSDVLLMNAEAILGTEMDKAKAVEYLNMVRRRAYRFDVNQTVAADSGRDFNPDPALLNMQEEVHNIGGSNIDPEVDQRPTIEVMSQAKQLQIEAGTIGSYKVLPIDYSAMTSAEDLLVAIMVERRKELCYEGHRRDDLIRNGVLGEVISKVGIAGEFPSKWSFNNYPSNASFNATVNNGSSPRPKDDFQPHKYRFPIPQKQLDINENLSQNSGY